MLRTLAKAIATMYQAPQRTSLLEKTGDIRTFMNWYCQKMGKTKLTQADLEGQAYEVLKAFYPDVGSGQALSISKMKAARYHNFGLELLVPEHMWIDDVCTYDINVPYSLVMLIIYLVHPYGMLSTYAVKLWTQNLVIRAQTEGLKTFKLIMRAYKEIANLTKTGCDATRLRVQLVDIEKVTVCSSLRSLKPKCTIESRAKRSSINLIRTLFYITCSSHNVKTKVIIRVLRIILVVLPEHPSDTYVFTMKMEILLEPTSNKLMVGRSSQDLKVQVKMEMEIPHTSGVYFMTACSYSTNTSNDIRKVQAYVSKLLQL
ncbi:hypothetical protein Tco_0570948 [Tanacetum coccineum]